MSRGAEPLGGEAARRRKRASRGYMLPLPVWNTGALKRICGSKSKRPFLLDEKQGNA